MSNFGNRCEICGGWFDEAGICPAGHERKDGPESNEFFMEIECRRIRKGDDICTCNICGGYFPAGNLECDFGHIIGQKYQKKFKLIPPKR